MSAEKIAQYSLALGLGGVIAIMLLGILLNVLASMGPVATIAEWMDVINKLADATSLVVVVAGVVWMMYKIGRSMTK